MPISSSTRLALIAILQVLVCAAADGSVYLFYGYGAEFIRIDTALLRPTAQGTLQGRIGRPVQDVLKRHILLRQPAWKQTSEIAVFEPIATGLRLVTRIVSPEPGMTLVDANTFGREKRRTLISWSDDEGKRSLSVLLEGDDYREVWRTPSSVANWKACLSSDGSRLLLPPLGSVLEVKVLDLVTRSVATRPLRVGPSQVFSKGLVAFEGCLALVRVNERRSEGERAYANLYVYDLERDRVVGSMKLDFDANSYLLGRGSLVMLEAKRLVPFASPNGSETWMKERRSGDFYLHRIATGKRIGELKVPSDGKILGLSLDQKLAFHIADKLLTIIDMGSFKIARQMELPFPAEFLAEVDESTR